MNLFDQQITLSVNSVVVILVAVFVLCLIGLVIFLLVKQHKAKQALQPKYGFLGKSLYAILGVLVLGSGVIFGVMSIGNNSIYNIEAKKTMNADVVSNVLLKDNGYTYVDFKVVPTVEGKTWGKTGDKFTVYWNISGDSGESYSYIEQDVSDDNRSGIQKYVLDGNYQITVNIIYDGSTYTFTKAATF